MASRAERIKSTAEFFNIAKAKTAEETRRLTIETAHREHARVLGGRRIPFTQIVDGTEGRQIEAVKAFGVIQFDYHLLQDVVQFALETLFDFSPVLKDEYRRAHTLFINDVQASDMKNWKPGDNVVILNPLPYSRKIERGAMKMRVPGTDHVYERAALAVDRRYGNIASTRFTYRSAEIPPSMARASREAMQTERETRVPALIFEEYV